MNKHRSKIIICLSVIFLIILSALFIAMSNKEARLAGAAVAGQECGACMFAVSYLPIIVLLGLLIVLLFYCEKWY